LKTIQLRRYEITPGKMAEFLHWIDQDLMPVRTTFGFKAEWRYIDVEKNEYIWAVSLPTDEAGFLAIQAEYEDSAGRNLAFESYPNCITQKHVNFVAEVI
jgi:hypothetical protein